MAHSKKLAETLPTGASPLATTPESVELAATLQLDTHAPATGDTAIIETHGAPPAAAVPPDKPGYVVALRYRLVEQIGRGAHGRVWEAEDLLAGGRVALKMLSADFGSASARIRREVASMRLLRLSGVVQLLDEGTDGDRPFIVMERVHGAPFPGVPLPASWARIARPTIALLETLSRMHAHGIVHRDLKPANVLVDESGRAIILDFGLARPDTTLDEGVTDHGSIVGTPAYLAPEQVCGDQATARADLYAVGIMLFESLSGRFPHPLENMMRMLQARLRDPPAPLATVAPAAPPVVAAIVDALLSRDPEGRPRSAGEVLDRLRGQAASRPVLRRLGKPDAVDALVSAALAGASIDVHGMRGSGRTRALDDAAVALGRAGRHVIRVGREGRVPTAAEVAGAVVIADDADALAPEVAAAVAVLRERGPVLRAFTGPAPAGARAVTLEPLAEEDLRALFSGTSRLFHLPEDAARVLHRRTEGLPARVADDVTGWIQAGLARWDGDRVSVDRDVVERLEAGLLITPLGPLPRPAAPLSPELDDLLGWVLLAHPHADASSLAVALGTTSARLAEQLAALEAAGAVRVLADGRVEPLCAPHAAEIWDPDRRREVHRRIAFAAPRGTPRRLYHLITGADDDVELGTEIAAEAQHLGRRLAVEGRLGLAAAAVSEGLRAERRLGMSGAAESLPLLTLAVEIALEDGTPRALDRVLYELYRIKPRSPAIERLAQLVRVALAVWQRTERALADATELGAFADPGLERRRHELRVLAMRGRPTDEQEALLEEMRAWAEASPDPSAHGAYAGWVGRLRYRQGRFAEAADLNAQAAAAEHWVTAKLAALLISATSRMEARQLDEAAAAARDALETARRYRLPFHEARAERVLRSATYRMGAATAVDVELVDAAANLRVGDWEALLSLNEAAIAYRAGNTALALDLARRAERAWNEVGEVSGGALLAAALALACGGAITPEDLDRLVHRALECPLPAVGAQTLGLVALAGRASIIDRARLAALIERIAPAQRKYRLEVLSVDEALEAIDPATSSRRRS
jgi:predicted Ser/Thr protein kinase